MATWKDITDAALEPGKPIRSVDGFALRDNLTALAEGAAGSPGVASAALIDYPWGNEDIRNSTLGAEKFQSGATEINWVLGRTSDAGAGAVGTYAFAQVFGQSIGFGQNISGGNISPSSTGGGSGGLSGTWKCMGNAGAGDSTVFLRIS